MIRKGIFNDRNRVPVLVGEAIHVSYGNFGRRIVIRRSGIDRDVNFAKKTPNFVKINTESIKLTENPSDFVEPYLKKPELLVIVPYSVNFVKKIWELNMTSRCFFR